MTTIVGDIGDLKNDDDDDGEMQWRNVTFLLLDLLNIDRKGCLGRLGEAKLF